MRPVYAPAFVARARGRAPISSAAPKTPSRSPDDDAQDRDPRHRPHPLREARRRPQVARRHRPRRQRHRGRARARRGRARPGRARGGRPGAAGRPGPDPLAPGPDQGRHPQGGLVGDRQQGLRLGHARGRDHRPGSPRGRPRGRRGGRHGVDVERALPAPERPLRLPHGRRQGARRDDPRRPDQPVHRQADGRRGDRGRRRARDHPPRPRQVRAAQPRARDPGDRRGPAGRGDRAGHDQLEEGRHRGRGRRGPAPRRLARDARQAARAASRTAPTPPATRRA